MQETQGQRLRRYRKAFGYTEVELGKLAGVNRRHICEAEGDKRELTLDELLRIAEVLDVPVEALRDGALRGVDTDTLTALHEALSRMPKDKQQEVVRYFRQQAVWQSERHREEGTGTGWSG